MEVKIMGGGGGGGGNFRLFRQIGFPAIIIFPTFWVGDKN